MPQNRRSDPRAGPARNQTTYQGSSALNFAGGDSSHSPNHNDTNGKIRIPITLSQSIQYALIPIIVTENGGATTRDYEVSHDSAYFRNRGNAAVTVYAKDDTVVDGNGEGITLSPNPPKR